MTKYIFYALTLTFILAPLNIASQDFSERISPEEMEAELQRNRQDSSLWQELVPQSEAYLQGGRLEQEEASQPQMRKIIGDLDSSSAKDAQRTLAGSVGSSVTEETVLGPIGHTIVTEEAGTTIIVSTDQAAVTTITVNEDGSASIQTVAETITPQESSAPLEETVVAPQAESVNNTQAQESGQRQQEPVRVEATTRPSAPATQATPSTQPQTTQNTSATPLPTPATQIQQDENETETSQVTAPQYTEQDDWDKEGYEAAENYPAPLEQEKMAPSRSITIKNNQYLDIEYPGSGWLYLGEVNGTGLFRYFGRKIGAGNTTFALRSKEEGTALLRFHKNDPLTGNSIDDYLSVTVSGINNNPVDRVTAPSYAEVVPKGQRNRQNPQITYREAPSSGSAQNSDANSSVSTASASTSSISVSTASNASTGSSASTAANEAQSASGSDANGDELLEKAKEAYNGADYASCLSYLTEFFNNAESRLDEALYLQGQALEAPSDSRNIKASLDTYQTLVKLYPQSPLWQAANERVKYLQRFYFTIY